MDNHTLKLPSEVASSLVTLQEYAELRDLVVPEFSSQEPACFAPELAYAAIKLGWLRTQRETGEPVRKTPEEFDRLVKECCK